MSHVVVVESPAKAKTINKYLGGDYTVLASFGHVRDLPSKDGSVLPDDNFSMHYEVSADSKKHMAAIAKALKGADSLYLATDPDREGEAISWHLVEALREQKALKDGTPIHRIAFHEITKRAVNEAIAHPRAIDMDLVNAQQARRALDYLVGFTLSPVLWRKLPGSRSAGRVQSVALRLICERDQEIELFDPQEYWDVSALMAKKSGESFTARLTHFGGEKLEKFSIPNEAEATRITTALRTRQYSITSVTPKQTKRNPYPPFTTSTLQMDASRRLGFGTKKTMQLAQKLYEGIDIGGETVGLITYMRTDAVTVATEAIMQTRDLIKAKYGAEYLPDSPRMYKSKAKNAQEAHEAIRPTDLTRTPEQLSARLDKDMWRLYELIWKRMMACQMEPAIYDQVVAEIDATDKSATFRATGSVLKFDGFLTLYQLGKDEDEEDEESRRLPPLAEGEAVQAKDAEAIAAEQHFTQPPPRYTEASLVKKLEELGIGRPSTYASIISTLIDRKYVTLDQKRFRAESLGRLVSAFLTSFFTRYVEYDFTAKLEDELDDISNGEKEWKQVLQSFWTDFIAKIEESQQLTITDILETLDKLLEPYIFGHGEEEVEKARHCPTCKAGRLSLKTGKFGAFLGCSNYPDCTFTKPLVGEEAEGTITEDGAPFDFPKILGKDTASDQDVVLKKGPYGVYIQLGEEKKPKRASLPKGMRPEQVSLEIALNLLSLPREVGEHPESGKTITAGIGRFGPYLLHDGVYVNLGPDDDVLTIGMNRAVTLIAEKGAKKKGLEKLRDLGAHPDDGKPVEVFSGRYGPYVKHGKTNASLPKGAEPESFTLEEATALLAKKKSAPSKKKPSAKKKSA